MGRHSSGKRRRSASSSSSRSSVEGYRKREKYASDITAHSSYTPRQSRPCETSSSSPENASLAEANANIKKLQAVVEQLTKRSIDSERSYHQTRVTIKSDCIPEFSPDNRTLTASQWIEKVDQLRQINSWDDVATIYHMQSRLTGNAKLWYHGLPSYNYTWTEWKSLIKKSFPDHRDYATLLQKMLERTKVGGETMTTYYFEKMEMLKACDINGKNAVSCLIAGLPETNLQNAARAGRYESPESLFEEFLSATCDEATHKREKMYRPSVTSKVVDRRRENLKDVQLNRSSNVKCFNCGTKGHIAAKCAKPKIECQHCHLLGHDVTNCWKKNKDTTATDSKSVLCCSSRNNDIPSLSATNTDSNSCYFIDCTVNGHLMRGYVDSGSSAVTIRDTETTNLNLHRKPVHVLLRGYGGGSVFAHFAVELDLSVDLAFATVTALVVPSQMQQVPIIVGQPFINNKNVVMVVREGQVRLFHKADVNLSTVDTLPSRKINIYVKETTIIPPHHLGHISVESAERSGESYVDLQYRPWPLQFHIIPRCILNLNEETVLPILNTSDQPVQYSKGRIIARGVTCTPGNDENNCIDVNTVTSHILAKFRLPDININEAISPKDKKMLLEVVNRYRSCFATNLSQLGKSSFSKMSIKLADDTPITYRPYRISYFEREKVRKVVQNLLDNKVIQESTSPYSSPILLIRKKNGEERLCVDYRALNRKTIKDKYPLPRIDDLLDSLKGCQYFTSLDLASGYHQICLEEESIPKTAFITPDGHYEYLRMPFGLVNAPAVFQRTMNELLGSFRFTTALAYLDDILIPSDNVQTGISNLETILNLIEQSGMTLRLDKCHFLQNTITYLGHEISKEGIQPGSEKINSVVNFPAPTNVHEVRQFLGLSSYFRKFIHKFAVIAKPLTNLTRKGHPFRWSQNENQAFNDLKQKLTTRPVLSLYDREAFTELHTDASKVGIGGILLQKQDNGDLKPVLYYSRATTPEEQKYHSYDLETLAVVESLKRFRVYLIGITFKVVTDCNALRSTLTKRDIVPRIARWWLATQEFDFSIEYRPGTKMGHVDALSRNPVPPTNIEEEVPMCVVNINEDDWVLSAQLSDKRCKEIHETLTEKPNTTEYKNLKKEYVLKGNRLYRVTEKGEKWVVPKTARRQILTYYHDGMGHFGTEKTLEAIQNRYWFSSMRNYVRNYISACLGCLYNKKPTGKRPGSLHSIDKKDVPMDTLHLDHLGPFVKSRKQNSYLIVAIDGFTKFVFMKAVRNTSTKPVLKFLDEICEMFGVPRRLISDRGTAFTSATFKNYCQTLNIKHVLCATATPRANGQVERMNRTILSALTSTVEQEELWDESLSKIRWGINATISTVTGKTPYEVFLGYRPRGIADACLSAEVCDQTPVDVSSLRADVSETIVKKQLLQKQAYDKRHASPIVYHVGQQVLVRAAKSSVNTGISKKLEPRYKGPYVVTKVLDNDRYLVEDMPGAKRARVAYKGICPSDKLKAYKTNVSSGSSDDDPSS